MKGWRPVLAPLAALVACLAAVAWLTWPLVARATTDLADTAGVLRADHLYTVWVLSWVTHALTTSAARVVDVNIYWPATGAFFYGPLGLGALPYFAPVFLVTANPVLAINVTIVTCLALGAWILHLVTVAWTRSALAGMVAAATFLTTPAVIWQTTAAPHYVVLQYIPLLAWLAAPRETSPGRAAAIAVVLALQSLTDLVYVAPSLFATLGVLAAARLVRPATRASGRRLVFALAGAGVLLGPFVRGYVGVRLANPHIGDQTVWPATDAWWATPGSWLPPNGPMALQTLPLVVIAAGAAACWFAPPARRAPQAWAQAALWAGVGFGLSWLAIRPLAVLLPEALRVVLRGTARLGYGGLAGTALLAGLAFQATADALAARVPSGVGQGTRALLAVAVLLGLLAGYRARVPPVFPLAPPPRSGPETTVLRAGAGPVLELPLGGSLVGPAFHARAMYRSIGYWRPLLNGYSSYYPADFPRLMALAGRLPDREALATLRRETGLETVVLRLDDLGPLLEARWRLITGATGLGDRPDLAALYRDKQTLVLQVRP